MMGRFLVLVAAFVVTLGGATFAGVHILSAVERQSTTTTESIQVGSLTRQYEVIKPTATLPKSAPIIVVLQGAASTTSNEIARDRIAPYADADEAEVVYPVAIDESWNAIGCCDGAAKANVNDVGFIEALVPKLDPGHTRPIYVVGYSVGGRLAYRLACTDPTLFVGMAVVKADPMPGCVVTTPMNVIDFSSQNDTYVPFKPGEPGKETPAATVQIATLEKDMECSSKPSSVKTYGSNSTTRWGPMTVTTWSCADGKTLEWAVDPRGQHGFPIPGSFGIGANQLIYSWITKTPLAPVPS
jgi:poly(3-hydroxybutyrate) depolymerase